MALYLGFVTMDPDLQRELSEKLRSGKMELRPCEIPEPLGTNVRELSQKLPRDCKILGRYWPADGIASETHHAVCVVETNNPDHLALISEHCAGFATIDWQLSMAV